MCNCRISRCLYSEKRCTIKMHYSFDDKNSSESENYKIYLAPKFDDEI